MKAPRKTECDCPVETLEDFEMESPTADQLGFVVFCPKCNTCRVLTVEQYERMKSASVTE